MILIRGPWSTSIAIGYYQPEMCYLCLERPVTYVLRLYTQAGIQATNNPADRQLLLYSCWAKKMKDGLLAAYGSCKAIGAWIPESSSGRSPAGVDPGSSPISANLRVE